VNGLPFARRYVRILIGKGDKMSDKKFIKGKDGKFKGSLPGAPRLGSPNDIVQLPTIPVVGKVGSKKDNEKRYSEKELGLAMDAEYDTGYYNGWTTAVEEVESILTKFGDSKDSWTMEEVLDAINKAKQSELSVIENGVRVWVGGRERTELVPVRKNEE
jgi:hypothetical protein